MCRDERFLQPLRKEPQLRNKLEAKRFVLRPKSLALDL